MPPLVGVAAKKEGDSEQNTRSQHGTLQYPPAGDKTCYRGTKVFSVIPLLPEKPVSNVLPTLFQYDFSLSTKRGTHTGPRPVPGAFHAIRLRENWKALRNSNGQELE